ncbi:hypothetical protein BDV11DRAFT_215237 [Aspergillus similis]
MYNSGGVQATPKNLEFAQAIDTLFYMLQARKMKLRLDATSGNSDFTSAAIVTIGAGISVDLIRRNKCYNFVILEKSSGVGGTWRDNKYPGCCCDVLAYLTHIAEKYGLYKYIRFNSEVTEARWSEFLISAVGQLNFPREPDIAGLTEFRGKMMHSARWDWSYNYENKRIAIIGNGATAAQIVPEVAKTSNWVIPRSDTAISPFEKSLLTYLPQLRIRKRSLTMDFAENFHRLSGTRNDYYPARSRENVDLETRRILRITETGIAVEGDAQQEYDLIILATGFKTVDLIWLIEIHGSKDRPLTETWKDGASACYGVTVEDLPNFGMFYGPNTKLGHSSVILMVEAQSRYLNAIVARVFKARTQGKTLVIKPTVRALRKYSMELQKALARSSFADANCSSWYKTENGKITNNWPGTVIDYQRSLSHVHEKTYISNRSLALTIAGMLAVAGGVFLRWSSLV